VLALRGAGPDCVWRRVVLCPVLNGISESSGTPSSFYPFIGVVSGITFVATLFGTACLWYLYRSGMIVL
jgi:hypothetical protein